MRRAHLDALAPSLAQADTVVFLHRPELAWDAGHDVAVYEVPLLFERNLAGAINAPMPRVAPRPPTRGEVIAWFMKDVQGAVDVEWITDRIIYVIECGGGQGGFLSRYRHGQEGAESAGGSQNRAKNG